jgi:hypothetical protein
MHVSISRLVLSIAVFSSQNRSAEPKAEGENDDEDEDDNKKSRVASKLRIQSSPEFRLADSEILTLVGTIWTQTN